MAQSTTARSLVLTVRRSSYACLNVIYNTGRSGLKFLYQHAAMGAVHESDERYPPPLCHPETRVVIVGRVIGWYLNKDGRKKILWVHAPLGYGKTAVAGTVKETLDKMDLGFNNPVGATFFFWRTSPKRSSPAHFVTTLAYQLAQCIPELRPFVNDVIKSKPGIVELTLEIQLVELIVEPFKLAGALASLPNRLIIVDGIDECIDSGQVTNGVEKKYAEDQERAQIRVLDLIHRLHSYNLPLSFLILSRPEAWIKQHLQSPRLRNEVEALNLHELEDHMKDAKTFARAELSRISASFGLEGVDDEWEDEQALVARSEGHMVYVATVIRHIDDEYGDPPALLKDILRSSSAPAARGTSQSRHLSLLTELYRRIMWSCPERNRASMIEVLEADLVFEGSYSLPFRRLAHQRVLDIFDEFAQRPSGSWRRAVRPLHAVVQMEHKWEGLFFHSSFREFLRDGLCPEFTLDIDTRREQILSSTLEFMVSKNITLDNIQVWNRVDIATLFALANWSWLWEETKKSRLSGLRRRSTPEDEQTQVKWVEKLGALDITACIIQLYHSRRFFSFETSKELSGPLKPLYAPRWIFRIPNDDSTHRSLESSLEHALYLLITPPVFDCLSWAETYFLGLDCFGYLTSMDNRSHRDWREDKVVQALCRPGPNWMGMFEDVVHWLWVGSEDCRLDSTSRMRAWMILEHIYKIMLQEKNPILEGKNPFRRYIKTDDKGLIIRKDDDDCNDDGGEDESDYEGEDDSDDEGENDSVDEGKDDTVDEGEDDMVCVCVRALANQRTANPQAD
ncbi:hypothetical protein MD484_g4300, partial [Candolleomyces efflorescens]